VGGSFGGVVHNPAQALVEILGRETPVDLTFAQVQKD